MRFQVICPRNKRFWSKFVTIMAGFCSVVVAIKED